MSQFFTNLDSILVAASAKLPKGSQVQEIKLTPDKKGIQIVWSHDDFKTGYLTPFEWSEEQLANRQLPAGTKSLPSKVDPLDPTIIVPKSQEELLAEKAKTQSFEQAPPLTIKVDTNPKKRVKAK